MCAVCYILLYMLQVELYLSMNGGKIFVHATQQTGIVRGICRVKTVELILNQTAEMQLYIRVLFTTMLSQISLNFITLEASQAPVKRQSEIFCLIHKQACSVVMHEHSLQHRQFCRPAEKINQQYPKHCTYTIFLLFYLLPCCLFYGCHTIFFGFLFLQTRVLSRASLSFSKSEDKKYMQPRIHLYKNSYVYFPSFALHLSSLTFY